ncbi:AP2/B3-like transcriptional factor family protein isoform 1 [Tripterygium wilfordii]|uniref:AP2/B3-like transcriptional factor family protein isoform 1 n=1 Tax=Tripterygium wilfordii TaxID=458696 RepID=A0A7J7CPV6_TRIWF|nr:AP2/B3-like transcriptional factor family protein isoform 1 [Tripterygium wilfordii]
MDREVKKEVEVEETRTTSTGEDHMTLTQLFDSPATNLRPRHSGKRKSAPQIIEKRLTDKKLRSESKIRQAPLAQGSKHLSSKPNRVTKDGSSIPSEDKSPSMIRAEEVQSNLDPMYPSFVKPLARSHVTIGFWMGLPVPFCKKHMPSEDITVTLEDECGKRYTQKYIAYKNGLSAGWRQFSIEHNLVEGDVALFQLVEPTKFKVYLIKANELAEVDGALGLLMLDPHTKQMDTEGYNAVMGANTCTSTKRKLPSLSDSLQLAVVQKNNKKSGHQRSVSPPRQLDDHSENDSEELGSEVLEGFKLSSPIPFEDITSFDNFSVLVDGFSLDSELPDDTRNKYYHLCCSQHAFLHDNLMKDLNFKLIVGIISETVNIADALKACKLNTSREEFSIWEKTLRAFQLLGLDVGFLLNRLAQIVSQAFDSEGAMETRRYIEAKTERALTIDEIRNLEAKLVELKDACERFDADIENL